MHSRVRRRLAPPPRLHARRLLCPPLAVLLVQQQLLQRPLCLIDRGLHKVRAAAERLIGAS